MNTGTVHLWVVGLVASFWMASNAPGASYTGPDFNGDGTSDLASVYEDQGGISVHVSLSTGNSFRESSWLDHFGTFSPTDRYFYGDFNGDGKTDLAALHEDGGEMSCDVFVSNGSAFSPVSWASRSGTFLYTDKWFKGDFDGDGRTDLARGYHIGADRYIDLYFTRDSGFSAPQPGGTVTGGFHADDVWLTGDFNGDGKTDIAVVEGGEQVAIRVHLSTGSSLAVANWAAAGEHGRRLASMKWVAEDFSGDGRTDIAKVWNDQGKVSMDVHRSTGDDFVQESWLKQSGDFVREWKWFVADGNGDGAADVMCLRDDDGQVNLQSFQSAGASFTSVPPVRSGAAYRDLNTYLVGDFDGNGGSDVAAVWADGTQWKSQIISGGASAVPVSSDPPGPYPWAGIPGEPVWGDDFLNLHEIRGAVPVGTDLQAVLDAGNDLFLVRNAIYNLSSTLKYRTSYQRIETHHPTVLSDNAVLRMQIDQGDYDTLIDGNKQSFVHLANVIIDGNKYALGPRYRAPGAGQGAMVFFSHAEGVWLKRCVMYNTRTWSTCHMVESGASHSHIAEHNYILGAGVDPRGNGMDIGEQVTGDNPTWADGFSISATNTVCRDNFIMDTTDVGVVLFGAPGSKVQNNMIVNYSRGTHGGINLVDATPARYLDDVVLFGSTMERYDYRGTVIEGNRISAAGARIMIGIPFGRRVWANRDRTVFDQRGGAIRNNRLEGGAFGYGFVLDHVVNVNVSGNASSASHSGRGVGTPENDNDPDPATAFLWDPDYVTGQVQPGFTDNTKIIEDLLWHHGQPTTPDGFFYYPYTPETAEATTRAAYWEILGRQPTSQELADGQNAFLADDRLFGDAFRRQLMRSTEFVEKFGAVTPRNLHVFRTARWRDRLLARDAEAVIQTGAYPDPRTIYDLAHADMAFQLTGTDAEISAISPPLPTSLDQGETATVSVTIKNTGADAWMNTVGDPARFAFASVGDDTAFGVTRVYLPYGARVAPGQSHTFDLVLTAPPVAYAGEGEPATTSFPCNFRMMQETRGSFGESMTKHLGLSPQVAVENADRPPPDPLYDAAFVSQKILGSPRRAGIAPGSEMAVEITMLNCGNETSIPWSKDRSEFSFSLGSENPRDNRYWGTNRISLKPGEEVKPGEMATFVAKLPVTERSGTYPFQWQMISATPGASWFGAKTPSIEIEVQDSAPAIPADYAVAAGSTVPARVRAGEPLTTTFTFTNEGDTSWTPEDGYRLGEVETLVDRTTGGIGVVTSQYADSPAGYDAAHLFDNQVRTRYSTDHASAWVRYQFPQGKRHVITSYALAAVDSYGPGPERLSEPSFERGGNDWDRMDAPIGVSGDDARTGSSALRFEDIPFAPSSKSARMLDVPIVEGKTYDLSLWYKVPSLTSGNIRIDTIDEYDDQFAEKKIQLLTPEWTQLTGRFTATDSTVSIRFFSKGFDGTCYIDDVSLTEVDAGSDASDPGSWTLAGSNDGSNWTTVDTRSGIDFDTRGLRRQFAVGRPGSYAAYQLTASNKVGNALQFAEVELLTDEGIWTSGHRADLPGGTRIAPGESHTFTLNIDAPARPGTYFLRTRMVNEKGQGFGELSKKHAIVVSDETGWTDH